MKNSQYAIVAVLLIVVGAGAFYGGMQYQKSQSPSFVRGAGNFQRGAAGQGAQAGAAGNARFQGGAGGGASGSILSMDDKGITLKLRDGGSKIVYFSASTTVGKIDTGSKDDLKAGDNVTVMGTSNPDGSITASMVQIRPDMPPMAPASASSTK